MKSKSVFFRLLIGLSLFFSLASCSEQVIEKKIVENPDIVGKVVSVTDGDTIKVLTSSKENIKIRLAHIDCPERKQDYGSKAKEALASQIAGKSVEIQKTDKDRYGRIIGVVWCNNINLNRWMVANGFAWEYVKYSKDKSLKALQSKAKAEKRGLWAGSNPIPPWEFRRKK